MTRKITLTVNESPIKLDYFVAGFVDHVAQGILNGLKDTGAIKVLKLSIDNLGQVKINLNGAEVPLNVFANEIVKSTILGTISTLKGVSGDVNTLELNITR